MTSFEDGLWQRLVDEHDADLLTITAPGKQTNRTPLVIGGGLTAMAATAAAVVAIGAATRAQPAYAMTQNPDGSVTVTINELATAIPQLNAEFAQMGIQETVVPVTTNCSSNVPFLDIYPTGKTSDTVTLTAGGKWLAPGYTGVLAAEQLANGQIAMFVGALKPPVPSCFSATTVGAPQTGANGIPTITTRTVTPAG